MSADVVKEWGKAFDIKALIEEEKKQLSGKWNILLDDLKRTRCGNLILLGVDWEEGEIVPNFHCIWPSIGSFQYYTLILFLGLSSADEGTAMAMEASHPLMEAFQGEELEEEEAELEEDMV